MTCNEALCHVMVFPDMSGYFITSQNKSDKHKFQALFNKQTNFPLPKNLLCLFRVTLNIEFYQGIQKGTLDYIIPHPKRSKILHGNLHGTI